MRAYFSKFNSQQACLLSALFSFLRFCVSVYVCAHAHVCVSVSRYTCICGGWKTTVSIITQEPSTLIFEMSLPLTWSPQRGKMGCPMGLRDPPVYVFLGLGLHGTPPNQVFFDVGFWAVNSGPHVPSTFLTELSSQGREGFYSSSSLRVFRFINPWNTFHFMTLWQTSKMNS